MTNKTLFICENCGDENYLRLIKHDKDLFKFVEISKQCPQCSKDPKNDK